MTEASPIFGLTREQLRPIAESMAGEPLADFTVSVEREPQGFPGWAGDKLIPTFRWRTEAGRTGEKTTCVKRMRKPWMQEARHYGYLHAHGFPACARAFTLMPRLPGGTLEETAKTNPPWAQAMWEAVRSSFAQHGLLRPPFTRLLDEAERLSAGEPSFVHGDYAAS